MTANENKVFIERLMEARSRRDTKPYLDALADDCIWEIKGTTAWSGRYLGKTEMIERVLKPLHGQFTSPTRIMPSRILADGDIVVVQCKGDATTVTGKAYTNEYCIIFRVEDGQIREVTEYLDTALVDRVLEPPRSAI